jgi:hypothetical protein
MKPHMCRYENTLILVHLVLVLALNTLRTTVSTVSTSWYGGGGGYQQFPVASTPGSTTNS